MTEVARHKCERQQLRPILSDRSNGPRCGVFRRPLRVCEHFVNLVDCFPFVWQLGHASSNWPPNSGGTMPSNRERIRSAHAADGGIVLDIDRGKMFSLNASGSVIFQFLEKGFGEEKIIEELVRRFEIPAHVAKQDLNDFREALRRHALLTPNQLPASE